jgi:hypothetical protein
MHSFGLSDRWLAHVRRSDFTRCASRPHDFSCQRLPS